MTLPVYVPVIAVRGPMISLKSVEFGPEYAQLICPICNERGHASTGQSARWYAQDDRLGLGPREVEYQGEWHRRLWAR